MSTTRGVVYQDLVPLPDDTGAVTDPHQKETAHALGDGATISHQLATSPTEQAGHAQLDHDLEVKDLGWNESKDKIAHPLVGGMENEDLWVLIRRFNKVGFGCFDR